MLTMPGDGVGSWVSGVSQYLGQAFDVSLSLQRLGAQSVAKPNFRCGSGGAFGCEMPEK